MFSKAESAESKRKVPTDTGNPAFKEPFKYGWKRALVYRVIPGNSVKKRADIYYYTPKGYRLRNMREVAEMLHTKELTTDNFTFCKEPLGLDDPEKEIIRNAKRGRKTKSPPDESEMLPPVPGQCSQPPPVEKSPPAKRKRPALERRQSQAEAGHRQHFIFSDYYILLLIFKYLRYRELLRAARVCRMWRDVAVHPSLMMRMNSYVTDWDGFAETLKRRGTQHLDLRNIPVTVESNIMWQKFVSVIPRVTSLVTLELGSCSVVVVEEVIKSCPQLEVLRAMSINYDPVFNFESVRNLKRCQELKLKATFGISLEGDLSPLQTLTQLTYLSVTTVKDLSKRRIDILESLTNLETLELGKCSDFSEEFGTRVLPKLHNLKRLRLEEGQGSCCTFDILESVSKLENLSQLELVEFDVKNGFDKRLANCKNIKRLLIAPTNILPKVTTNNMILGGVTELSNNLTHFVWGIKLDLFGVPELFVDQCNQMNKQVTDDSIPVLKPVPCLNLIEDIKEDDSLKGDDQVLPNTTKSDVETLPLPQLQKFLLTRLPKTKVDIWKIPLHAKWSDAFYRAVTKR